MRRIYDAEAIHFKTMVFFVRTYIALVTYKKLPEVPVAMDRDTVNASRLENVLHGADASHPAKEPTPKETGLIDILTSFKQMALLNTAYGNHPALATNFRRFDHFKTEFLADTSEEDFSDAFVQCPNIATLEEAENLEDRIIPNTVYDRVTELHNYLFSLAFFCEIDRINNFEHQLMYPPINNELSARRTPTEFWGNVRLLERTFTHVIHCASTQKKVLRDTVTLPALQQFMDVIRDCKSQETFNDIIFPVKHKKEGKLKS